MWVPEDRGGSWKVVALTREPRTKLEGRNIDVELVQGMGPRKEVARRGEETNHDTLWYSKWKLGSEEIGSQ